MAGRIGPLVARSLIATVALSGCTAAKRQGIAAPALHSSFLSKLRAVDEERLISRWLILPANDRWRRHHRHYRSHWSLERPHDPMPVVLDANDSVHWLTLGQV